MKNSKTIASLLIVLGFILLAFGLTLMIKGMLICVLVMAIGFVSLMTGLFQDANIAKK